MKKVLLLSLFLVLPVLFILVSYIYFLNFDDGSMNGKIINHDFLYSHIDRKGAKFLSLLAGNSKIYKGFIFYTALKNPVNRPVTGSWRGVNVAVVGLGNSARASVYQGISSDTYNVTAVPAAWDEKSGLLTVSVDGNNLALQTDRSTLMYQVKTGQKLIPLNGSSKYGPLIMGANGLQLFVVDEGQYPVILDGLILTP